MFRTRDRGFGRAAAVWGGILLLIGCGPPPDFGRVGRAKPASPRAELQGVVFDGYSAGSRDVEVHAVRAWVDPANRVVDLSKVRIGFEDEKRGKIQIRAQSAQLRLDTDDFVLRGQVEGTTGEGERFTTAEVRYEQARERLWTDQPVELHRSNLLLKGGGMELHVPTRRVRITGDVRATLERG
ncbi:MAG: LPS export ABC transporter periplasmic protein LptC [Candidatus Zixiibacteriota bacterium]|nr:MAG: LPS export ABC transporter periplasmic protein LptC [candidate division Zixibacteria bacterium]